MIGWAIGSIDRKYGKKTVFWKIEHFNAETPQSTLFYEWNAWIWDENFFKNPWIELRSSKKKLFNQIFLKAQTLKHILHQNQGNFNPGWPQQVHTQYNVPSLAKNNLCNVCN